MRDPWQDDVLDELVAYLQAAREARASAWAVIAISSDRLTKEVLAALNERLGAVKRLDVSAGGENPRKAIEASLTQQRGDEYEVCTILGLPTVLASVEGDEFLSWLNFHREDFEEPAEAYLFILLSKHTESWRKLAPDLDRFTQHFDFIDWQDLIEDADRAAKELLLSGVKTFSLAEALRRAERRLERSRSLHEQEVKALVEVGLLAIAVGSFERARQVIETALSRADEMEQLRPHSLASGHSKARSSATRANALLASHLGNPDKALREIEELVREEDDEDLRRDLAAEHFSSGHAHLALAELERALTTNSEDHALTIRSNIAVVSEWLGEVRKAHRAVQGAPEDLRPWKLSSHAWLWGAQASLLIDSGRMFDALHLLAKSLRLSQVIESAQSWVTSLASLARATFDVGYPADAVKMLENVGTSPGWKSARNYGLAIVRAQASWVRDGPAAVLPIIRDERERQRDWRAPIPAAELVYVRALASKRDDEARRYFQEAADRFRAMDGLYYTSEVERWLARLDRLEGDLERGSARVQEGLEWHTREGLRPREALDRTELAMISLARGDADLASEHARCALELIRDCGTRLYEPAALVALAAAERALGHLETAEAHDQRWRRLVRGIGARGLEAALQRDADWARALSKH